jgi:hypothetical protein
VTDRGAALRLTAVFAAAVVVAWGAARLGARRPLPSRPLLPSLSSEGLRLAFVSRDISLLAAEAGAWPVYRGLSRDLRAAASGTEAGAPGVVALYRSGWIAWAGDPDGGTAPWTIVGSDETGVPREVPRTLPPAATPAKGSCTLVLRPREIFERTAAGLAAFRVGGIPKEAVGALRLVDGSLEERWEIGCPPGCFLAALDRNGALEAKAKGWNALPPDPDAVVWLLLDPEAAIGTKTGEDWEGLAAVERVLDLPMREAIAVSIAGPVVFALAEPREDGIPRLIAAIDLRRPEEARALLDRAFALGMLAEALEVTRYRGVVIGTWRPKAEAPVALALALDGDVLLAALRPEDLREAIDRRRSGAGARPHRRLAAVGVGSWKSWSRSRFVAAGWEEILSGRPASAPAAFEVTAVARSEGDRWIVRTEGGAPLLAAEALVPSARAAVRALRRER